MLLRSYILAVTSISYSGNPLRFTGRKCSNTHVEGINHHSNINADKNYLPNLSRHNLIYHSSNVTSVL